MKSYLVLILTLVANLAFAQGARIVIDKGVDNPTRIAVVPFNYSGPKLAEDIPEIIRNDLNFSGQFESIPTDKMISYPMSESEIRYRDWKMINAEYILIGGITEQAGRYTASYELFDVAQQKRVFIRMSVEGVDSQLRDMAHKIGLGRKPGQTASVKSDAPASATKRGRPPR